MTSPPSSFADQVREDLACPDCPSEVRVTQGSGQYHAWRARVIHAGTCPWYRRYLAGEVRGAVPCGTVVTHRGPYKRDPAKRSGS